MRSRWVILAALALVLGSLALPMAAHAGGSVYAQADPEDETSQGEESGEGDTSGEGEISEGQSESETETGSEEADTGEAATETGPPWTYQMARISIVLMILLGLAVVRMYYKLVASRQRGAA